MPRKRSHSRSREKGPNSARSAVPRCEGFLIRVGLPHLAHLAHLAHEAHEDPSRRRRMARRVVQDTLPGSWHVRPLSREARDFEVLPTSPRRRLDARRAWEMTADLASHRDVVSAEPAWVLPGLEPDPTRLEALLTRAEIEARALPPRRVDLPCASQDPAWSLALTRIREAWELPLPGDESRALGEGILIGHPDTGYTPHPEIWRDTPRNRILYRRGFDYVDDDRKPLDTLTGLFPGHGTGTASVIMSAAKPSDDGPSVWGAAPRAQLIPFRVSTSVVHISFRRLAKSLYRAVDQGSHVISMSLGGPLPSDFLLHAIRHAVDQGVILLAAAGNVWPWVVYPARYDEVIAVAACNCLEEIWALSAGGEQVDVTAPGESVWVATARRARGNLFGVEMSSGTSHAVATAAGTCALWLAYHGRGALVERYGAANLASVFKEVLIRQGVRTPEGWNASRYGAGILDARKLLRAPLPPRPLASGLRAIHATPVPRRRNDLDDVLSYFPEADRGRVRGALLSLLKTSEAEVGRALARIGDELRFQVATDPSLREALLKGSREAGAIAARTDVRRRLSRSLCAALHVNP